MISIVFCTTTAPRFYGSSYGLLKKSSTLPHPIHCVFNLERRILYRKICSLDSSESDVKNIEEHVAKMLASHWHYSDATMQHSTITLATC